jgi:phenylacetate-CoA ligase
VVRREGTLDTLEVQVEARAEGAAARTGVAEAGVEAMRALAAALRRRVHEGLGLTAEITVVPPRTIERSAGKARRVEDLRPK